MLNRSPTRRLAVGFLENNISGGLVDGCWWPPGSGSDKTIRTVRECVLRFSTGPYTDAKPHAQELQQNIFLNSLPVMWMGTVTRRSARIFHSRHSCQETISSSYSQGRTASSEDEWNFNPTILVSGAE